MSQNIDPNIPQKANDKDNIDSNDIGKDDVEDDIDTEIFDSYIPTIDFGRDHPSPLVQTTALSSVKCPKLIYNHVLPNELIDEGLLSRAQLETVCYACQIFEAPFSSTGCRKGYFIGDGTGLGKGRSVAGIILENVIKHKLVKHLWVSSSGNLMDDAKRDLKDICFDRFSDIKLKCTNIIEYPKEATLSHNGILFSTYTALNSRKDQIIKWLGNEFQGCIIFDESHKAKGFNLDSDSEENTIKHSTITGSTVNDLQNIFKAARVVYCSATGATSIENYAFMSRLDLWGKENETVFKDFNALRDAGKRGGIGVMEIVCAYLKSKGQYNARTLSYDGCSYELKQAEMLEEERYKYDHSCIIWQEILDILLTGIEEGTFEFPILETELLKQTRNEKSIYDMHPDSRPLIMKEEIVQSKRALKREITRYYWSAHQRFFKSLCVSLKIPTAIKLAKEELNNGCCIVFGMQSTGEANLNKEIENKIKKINDEDHKDEDEEKMFSVPARMLKSLIVKTMPLPQKPDSKAVPHMKQVFNIKNETGPGFEYKPYVNDVVDLVTDSDEENEIADEDEAFLKSLMENVDKQNDAKKMRYQLALDQRDELFRRIDSLNLPGNPLDVIIQEFGEDNVAELTGRRIKTNIKGDIVKRTNEGETINDVNLLEKKRFMQGDKLVAIISEAASSGISLHADRRVANQRRRIHITLEVAWSSQQAVQQLGRTHRSNESSAPKYFFLISAVGGENRFGSAVCKRLQSMSALTQGDRGASSGSNTMDAFNYDTIYGKNALCKMLLTIESGEEHVNLPILDSIKDSHLISEAAAMRNCEEVEINFSSAAKLWLEGVKFEEKDKKVSKFLNRCLGIETKKQNYLFDAFESFFESEITLAKKEGRFDTGISRIQGKILDLEEPRIIQTHEYQIGEDQLEQEHTKHAIVKTDRGISWDEVSNTYNIVQTEFDKRQNDLRNIVKEFDRWQNDIIEIDGEENFSQDDEPNFLFGFYKTINEKPRSYIVCCAESLPVSYNKVGNNLIIWRPKTGRKTMSRSSFEDKYEKVSISTAKRLWNNEYNTPDRPNASDNRIVRTNLIIGSILPVWSIIDKVLREKSKVKDYKIKIMKTRTESNMETGEIGQRLIGIFVQDICLDALLQELRNFKPPNALIRSAPSKFQAVPLSVPLSVLPPVIENNEKRKRLHYSDQGNDNCEEHTYKYTKSSSDWNCSFCTFLHEGDLSELTSCSMCCSKRPDDDNEIEML